MIKMKKILIALAGIVFLVASCAKTDRYIEQNPYRLIEDYTPHTATMDVPGTLTPDMLYPWLEFSQSGNKATFTLRRNTSGVIRRAEFTIAGSNQKAIVNQKAHSLDASVSTALARNGNGEADVRLNFSSSFTDDYNGWGVIYGQVNDREKGFKLPGSGVPSTSGNMITIKDLEIGKDYFVWGYVTSTEGDIIYGSNTTGIIPPVTVRAGEDLQAAIDGAKEFAEVRVEAGAKFAAPIKLRNNVTLSGSWVNDFNEQDFTQRSVIDGNKKITCVDGRVGAGNSTTINGFELVNGTPGGLAVSGTVTVEWCRVAFCENSGQGGGIFCTEQKGDNLILANSIIEYNKADAHGGGIAINGAGTSVKVLNCLFHGNASIAQYGYTGAIHGQAGVQAYVVNSTFVENVNWRDGSSATASPWSAVMFRNSGTHIEFVNNIVAGNWYFLPGVASDAVNHPDRYDMPIKPEYLLEMQVRVADFNEIGGSDANYIVRSNILGGVVESEAIHRAGSDAARAAAIAACTFVPNSEFNTLFVNAAAGDFHPAGKALTTGENSDVVNGLLGAYTTDLDGKPRATGGKINAGCYQAQ